jgi:hypothetical protein
MDQMRLQYTDLHPDIQSTQRLIAKLEEQKKMIRRASRSGRRQDPEWVSAADHCHCRSDATVLRWLPGWPNISAASANCAMPNMIPVEQDYT